MNRHQKEIHKYCSEHSTPQSNILYELERETYLKTLAPQMMSGHLQGRFLSLLSKMQRPRRILELGVFTGYATLCLAEGLAEDGIIHAIEGNPELEYLKVNPGGILLADNVLWSGKVISGATDADTQLLDAFNKKVNADPRVENIIMPLRDGLTIIRKK